MQKKSATFDDSWKRNLYALQNIFAAVYATTYYTFFFARLNTQNIRFGLHVTNLHYEEAGRSFTLYGLARLCC